jgi:hypothetical protein
MTESLVRFTLPEYVSPAAAAFDGHPVDVEYDSNFNAAGETVRLGGHASFVHGGPGQWDALVVDGRYIRSNGHVFSAEGRHLGMVETMTVTVPESAGIALVTDSVDSDVDRGEEAIIVQTWDSGMMDAQGFMAGTDEIRLERV